MIPIIVTYDSIDCLARAHDLSLKLGLPLSSRSAEYPEGYSLHVSQDRLELRHHEEKKSRRLYVDLIEGPLAYRLQKGGGKKQAIARAIGILCYPKPIKILDLTAGLGTDLFVLGSLGCQMHGVERSPVIAALLEDGIKRASHDLKIGSWVCEIKLTIADAKDILDLLSDRPDVIYLDPMFPERTQTALVKKNMRMLQAILGEDKPIDFLDLALEKALKRVVVKRPKGAPYLQEKKPSFSLSGKSCRFDIYLKVREATKATSNIEQK